jgi:hypothetical protein
MERRLRKLDVLYRRIELARPQPVFDGDRLTMDERHELDALLARVEARPLRPNGRPDFGDLSDAELERANALYGKGQVA